MFQLQHTTSEYAIEHASVAELKEALVKVGIDGRGSKKPELQIYARTAVAKLLQKHEQEQQVAEKVRLAQLETDKLNPNFTTAKLALAKGYEKIAVEAREALAKLQEKFRDPMSLAHNMEWYAKDVFFQAALVQGFETPAEFFRKEVGEPTKTLKEFQALLQKQVEQKLREALDASVSESTSAIANVRSTQEVKVKQLKAKVAQSAARYFDEDLEKGTDHNVYVGSYVF